MIMIVKTPGSQMGSPEAAEEGGEAMGGGRGESGESSEVHERPSVTSTVPKARSRSKGVAWEMTSDWDSAPRCIFFSNFISDFIGESPIFPAARKKAQTLARRSNISFQRADQARNYFFNVTVSVSLLANSIFRHQRVGFRLCKEASDTHL